MIPGPDCAHSASNLAQSGGPARCCIQPGQQLRLDCHYHTANQPGCQVSWQKICTYCLQHCISIRWSDRYCENTHICDIDIKINVYYSPTRPHGSMPRRSRAWSGPTPRPASSAKVSGPLARLPYRPGPAPVALPAQTVPFRVSIVLSARLLPIAPFQLSGK